LKERLDRMDMNGILFWFGGFTGLLPMAGKASLGKL
jgi:hypothetical protein